MTQKNNKFKCSGSSMLQLTTGLGPCESRQLRAQKLSRVAEGLVSCSLNSVKGLM